MALAIATLASCGPPTEEETDESTQALTQSLRLPFPDGHTWFICQSYRGFSHGSNDPLDLGWTAASCNAGNNDTGGKAVVSLGAGTVSHMPNTLAGGDFMCVSLTGGGAFVLGHVKPSAGLAVGSTVVIGQQVATVRTSTDPAGQNAGIAHLHFEAWSGAGCYSGTPQPFTGAWRLNCAPDLPFNATYGHYNGTALAGCPAYAATLTGQSFPATMTAGEEVVAYLEYRNAGTATWTQAATRIGTTDPNDRTSPFFASDWLSATRPGPADAPQTALGAVARFTFRLRAPAVTTRTTFVEHFGPLQEGVTWFGPHASWSITVSPIVDAGAPVVAPKDAGVLPPPPDAGAPPDAGSPPEPPPEDAGTPTDSPADAGARPELVADGAMDDPMSGDFVGVCGCGSSPVANALGAALVFVLAKRRRRGTNQPP